MNYTLIIYELEDDFALRSDREKSKAYWGRPGRSYKGASGGGDFVGGAGLQPPDKATVVKLRGGQRHVQDGPYAETKEQLGGFSSYRFPISTRRSIGPRVCRSGPGGLVEVRPNLQMS